MQSEALRPVKASESPVGSGEEALQVPGSEQHSQRGRREPCRQQAGAQAILGHVGKSRVEGWLYGL